MRLLLDLPFLQLFHDYENDWLYANWRGEQDLQTVKSGCEQMLAQVKTERFTKVLNDNREVTSLWSDASDWVAKVWFPEMAEAGVQYFGWIYSPNQFSRLSTDLTIKYITRPIVDTFDDLETARNWLKLV